DAAGERDDGGAEAVEIGRRPGGAVELLGRHVPEGADDGRAALVADRLEHAAEIDERDLAVGVAEEVRRLDVAVDDRRPPAVEVGEELESPAQHVGELLVGEADLLGDGVERRARRLLHDDVVRAGRLLEVGDEARDAGMIERLQRAQLALEEVEALPAGLGAEAELLDRDALFAADRLLVAREERPALPAAPEAGAEAG